MDAGRNFPSRDMYLLPADPEYPETSASNDGLPGQEHNDGGSELVISSVAAPDFAERSRADWLAILRKHGIQPSRAMGQNFLVEPNIVRRIVDISGVQADELVVEIGPGLGILTRALLQAGADVVAIELDHALKRFLEDDLARANNLRVVERDARHVDIAELIDNRRYHVVANLPYSVATVVIRHFFEAPAPPVRMTVMVQREVAERMVAVPPDMSLLALATQLSADADIAMIVPPDVFVPQPKVESAIVRMHTKNPKQRYPLARDRMFSLATMAFQRKRKTIANGLSQGLDVPKREIEERLRSIDIDPHRRPQSLSLEEWLHVADALPESFTRT